jgi:hypothetical protein
MNITTTILNLLKEFDESPEEINNGLCADFADIIWRECDLSSEISFCDNENLTNGAEEYIHTFIKYKGLYYDSEAPYGVEDWKNLPTFKRIYDK